MNYFYYSFFCFFKLFKNITLVGAGAYPAESAWSLISFISTANLVIVLELLNIIDIKSPEKDYWYLILGFFLLVYYFYYFPKYRYKKIVEKNSNRAIMHRRIIHFFSFLYVCLTFFIFFLLKEF